VRKKVTESVDADKLETVFADVELFLALFPKDENIKKASVKLVVATFKAVEDAIGFFIRPSGEYTYRFCFCILCFHNVQDRS
jgi:hypothetical protein